MSFDYGTATEAEILARIEKFRRQAKKIRTQEHFDRVIVSFPPERRAAVTAGVRALLPFDVQA